MTDAEVAALQAASPTLPKDVRAEVEAKLKAVNALVPAEKSATPWDFDRLTRAEREVFHHLVRVLEGESRPCWPELGHVLHAPGDTALQGRMQLASYLDAMLQATLTHAERPVCLSQMPADEPLYRRGYAM